MNAESAHLPRMLRRALQASLRVPLIPKLLIANSIIVVAGAVVGTALTVALVRADPERSILELIGLFAAIGLLLSVLINGIVLRIALSPLKRLESTAQRVHEGDLEARVAPSVLADPQMQKLTEIFNQMLDSLAAKRHRLYQMATAARLAEENERKRVARELHDETIQALTSILINLRYARDRSERDDREDRLDELREQLVEAVLGIRRLIAGLRPPRLETQGLVPALSHYVRSVSEMGNARVFIESGTPSHPLSPDAELAVYRIVQEALLNSLRHSGAKSVRVEIEQEDGALVARVVDDGRGFAVQETISPAQISRDMDRGLGIFGMRERAEWAGGSVSIESAPGRGTRVEVKLPVEGERDIG